jgi:hypothetical protein
MGKYRPVARLERRLCALSEENLAHAPMPVAAHHDDHSAGINTKTRKP